jgi:polyhydroxyalkanoate synthase subunit PhaC
VLSTSGHIQALVNPPAEESRSSYRVADEHPATPDAWAAGAATRQGSWWPDYDEWLAARSGELEPAPKGLGAAGFRALAKAPGSYVHAS